MYNLLRILTISFLFGCYAQKNNTSIVPEIKYDTIVELKVDTLVTYDTILVIRDSTKYDTDTFRIEKRVEVIRYNKETITPNIYYRYKDYDKDIATLKSTLIEVRSLLIDYRKYKYWFYGLLLVLIVIFAYRFFKWFNP